MSDLVRTKLGEMAADEPNNLADIGAELLRSSVSYALLGSLFFCVITPVGIAFRVLGIDPLKRARDRKANTYWRAPRRPRTKRHYFQQF